MPTDDERRRVAERMRASAGKYDFCASNIAIDMGIVGSDYGEGYNAHHCVAWLRLADLIEPGEPVPGEICELVGDGMPECEPLPPIVDRDALLALADEMDGLCGPWHDCGKHYARRIREACGEVGA